LHRLRGMSLVALFTATLTDCVYITAPSNYRPQSASLSQDFYTCSQAANQPEAGIVWGSGSGYGAAGNRVSPNMLLRCMEARNYRLRKANGAEYAVGILFSPVWVPWVLLFGGGNQFILGGGSVPDDYGASTAPSASNAPSAPVPAVWPGYAPDPANPGPNSICGAPGTACCSVGSPCKASDMVCWRGACWYCGLVADTPCCPGNLCGSDLVCDTSPGAAVDGRPICRHPNSAAP
jgi:hypothetical protein